MRPHRLAFCALGPYPAETAIDFDQLVADGLFLIWGPTGAGKTFLLDALCFALYGEVPGERRHDALRSDHAPPHASPLVELEFTAQGTRWRICRTPWHERAKKRGEGTTENKPEATLERREGEQWRAVAQRIAEVNAEVTRLIGLTASQFQQVVLLPQGRFEKVLRSKSDEREKLLLTLFDTSIYASAASWLDEQAKHRRDTAAGIERELLGLRSRAADRWSEEFPFDESGGSPDDSAEPSGAADSADAPWPADQIELDELLKRAQSVAGDAAAIAATAEARQRSANEDHSCATQLAGRWDRREGLRHKLSRLVNAMADIKAKREALSLADDAEALRQVLDDEQSRRGKLAQRAALVSAHYAALRESLAETLNLPDTFAIPSVDDPALQSRLAHLGTQIALHLDKLSKFADDASTAGQRESDAAAKRDAAAAHLDRQEQLERAAAEHDSESKEAERELRDAKSAADRISALTAAATSAHERAEAAVGLQSLAPELSDATRSLQSAKDSTFDRRDEELDLRRRYLDGIAAVLAGSLVNAEPCPVCGSAEHPNPAEPAGDAVRFEHLEAASAAVERAVEAEERAGDVLQGIKSRIGELRGRAGDVADDADTAARQSESAAAELTAATELAGKQPALQDVLADHQSKAKSARQQSGKAGTAAALALAAAEAAEGDARELRSKISQAIGELDLDEAVAGLQAVESCLDELQTSVEDQTKARTALDALAGTLAAQLESSPFTTSDEAQSALLDATAREELRDEVARHDQAMHDTQRDLRADDLECLPDDRPDTHASQEAAEAATAAAKKTGEHHTRIASARDAIGDWADEHRNVDAEYASALADAELWTAAANRCSGRLPPKVSLQRWVLSAYLEQICGFASRRLGAMSGGRYRLSVYREGERQGAKAGLGLRVHDAHTGAEREVSTLSGGETFQASLSLALGVADVVTARTGGVHLDVLFVDEGFGTLDSEALQLAMDELDRLREGGRAVGLISHVSELRERIHTGIEVHRTDKGSDITVGPISQI
ncbi:AAA family ATPase [Candidatus Poriferisodalis sp.]|uniref:AAA family ATPase n=1 Tax=Candidatus Poriferisodalis sp. TaxID=3101277 RepID=UPI003B026461